jgi:hypothetical protein
LKCMIHPKERNSVFAYFLSNRDFLEPSKHTCAY